MAIPGDVMKFAQFLLMGLYGFAHALESEKRSIPFTHADGVYTNTMLQSDFGNGNYYSGRDYARIVSNAYQVTFKKGVKVDNTGAATAPRIPARQQYTLQYRIKYADAFESGLHGKQFGFNIGAGYNGGKGDAARVNGDEGSVRIQFDGKGGQIANQLYVYYSEMTGDYGNNPGGQKYEMTRGEWNTVRLTVTLNTSISKADGKVEVWCNGNKKIEAGGLLFVRKESGRAINAVSFESFPGGAGIFPSVDNHLYVDDFQWQSGRMEDAVSLATAAPARSGPLPHGAVYAVKAMGIDLLARKLPLHPHPLPIR